MGEVQLVEWEFEGKTEVLGENPTQWHHKSQIPWPGNNQSPSSGKPDLWHCIWLLFLVVFLSALDKCRDIGDTRHHSSLRHYATSRKDEGSIPRKVIGFFNWPNPSSRTMALGSTQPLTEMSTRNLPVGKGRPTSKADNVTAICEPTV
jgi:hypothetical protein